ncbi:MAG: bacillolysin [Saprospiraceae bacterium]|jgi:bacillolysin
MKHLFILLLSITFSSSAMAQLKTITSDNSTRASQTVIDVPNFKKITGDKTITTRNFVPRTLTYMPIEQNGLKVENRAKNNLPILISGEPELKLRSTDTNEGKALNFLENAKGLMSIKNPSEEFKILTSNTDELGITHLKYQQMYMGVTVYGAEVIYHFNNKSQWLNGRYLRTPSLESVTPSLDLTAIKQLTVNSIGGIKEVNNDQFNLFDFEKITAELIIYEDKLCYEMTVYKSIIDRWEYIMDAHTGEVVSRHQNMCRFHNHDDHSTCRHSVSKSNDQAKAIESTIENEMLPPPDGPTVSNAQDLFGSTRQINTYESNNQFFLIDAARTMYDNVNSNIPNDPIGTIWTIDAFDTNPQNSNFAYDHVVSNSSNFSGKQTGVSAQYNGGQAYQYFKVVHGRESINGSGGNVIGLINISDEDGSTLGNAFWNGIAMFYGNGDNAFLPLARGLDVAGHEMSHGVIQSTANLQYQGESGALNESFADIFGAMIDRDDWQIGEDVVKTSAFPSGALRSLQDPHNGASTGNFNAGWQPRTYSERFTGSQDNGGVHINSGIVNWAFFKFATSSDVGKNRAEKVYYRALDKYMTKSSQFIDARIAVVQAANDLYGAGVANSARASFDAVEIFNGNGTVVETDVETNPGDDLVLFTTTGQQGLYITDANGDFFTNSNGDLLFNPLTDQNPVSVPSVSDDGSEILFVNQDKELYYILMDWSTNSIANEGVIESNEEWRNAVFSKDGLRMAALREIQEDEIFVFDFETGAQKDFKLFNPTFSEGVSTGDVLFADALEFDFTGNYLMYDAFNRIESSFGNPIEYWDIGFINVFNTNSGTFTTGQDIQKLFSQLPEGDQVANPTFSKNSDYIIAFDGFIDGELSVFGSNIEEQETKFIYQNNDRPGYPSYSNDDDKVLFDAISDNTGLGVIGGAVLLSNKIESNSAAIQIGFESTGVKWGVWFANGERNITSSEEIELAKHSISLSPNPAGAIISINSTIEDSGHTQISIFDIMGRNVFVQKTNHLEQNTMLDVSALEAGSYILHIRSDKGVSSEMFVKE